MRINRPIKYSKTFIYYVHKYQIWIDETLYTVLPFKVDTIDTQFPVILNKRPNAFDGLSSVTL